MDINQYGDEFAACLGDELVSAAEISTRVHADQTLYAFCVLVVDGFSWVDVALNTREHFVAHAEEIWNITSEKGFQIKREDNDLVCELLSDEWLWPSGLPDDHFSRSNELLARFDREHEETAERWERGDQVLYEAVERAILYAREMKPALLDPDKILTGVQVIDACDNAMDDMIRISARVNAPHWHDKFLRYRES